MITMGPKEVEVQQILPDVWMLGGYLSTNFVCRPPASNVYLLRDDDILYIVDPGNHTVYRRKILELVEAYKRKGVTTVRLIVTQGHFDHSANDDVVRRTGLDWEFHLPQPEIPAMRATTDFMRDIEELGRYEDVYQTMFARTRLRWIFGTAARISPALAKAMLRRAVGLTMGDGDHMAGDATVLTMDQKVTRTYGSVTLDGWELGRFFLIHDGAHSPGHVCVYDPGNKLVLGGDTTIEINPAFVYSSMSGLIDITASLATMAREGAIEYVADGHRSARYFARLTRELGMPPLDATQLLDVMRGGERCAAFLDFFTTYYRELASAVFAAHAQVGRATVGEIVDEMFRSTNKYVRFKTAMRFPWIPSRVDVLVVQVLKEAGAVPITTDDGIVFDPIPRPVP